MILTKNKILDEIKKKRIVITPLNKKNIGPASVDLTLDNKFRTLTSEKIALNENTDYKKHSKSFTSREIVLKPGAFILGITKEQIKLPENICGSLSGRSRFARLGLVVHITASFVQPGINNKQILEIKNSGDSEIILKPGLKICQLIVERTEGKAKYKGKFRKQKL